MASNLINKNNNLKNASWVDGWLSLAQPVASPNFNQRPHSSGISLLIIHNISLPPEQFGDGYIESFFCNRLDRPRHPYFETIANVKVSSHFMITRKGKITQFVATENRAWHAGESSFEGRDNCNDFSIGVELEGADNIPYSQYQYASLGQLTKMLIQKYSKISVDRIVGHSTVSPGRKTDPGPAFDWKRFYATLN
jgi:AmpD protein